MVQIQIGQGQGITQAIKTKIESDIGPGAIINNNLSVWQSVMQEVKNANENRAEGKDPFYTGEGDVSKIGARSTFGKDFKTAFAQVIEFSQDVWNRIIESLTGKTPEVNLQEETLSIQTPTKASVAESKNPNLTLEQNQALHKKVVDKSVKFIEDNFEGSPLEEHFSSEEDKILFLECLHSVEYKKDVTGAGSAENGVIYIETNNEQVNSDSEMTKLLIHEANHAFKQQKALKNSTLNFPTKAEEIECETLALTTMSHFVKNCSMEDYNIYGRKISDFVDKSIVHSDREFINWLEGYQQLADNLQGDITIKHSPYKNSKSNAEIYIKSGDIVRIGDQTSFEIGKSAFFEGVDDTAVAQLIMHQKDFSNPDCSLAPGRIVFDALGATSEELANAIDENFDRNNFDLIPVTIERVNPKTGGLEVVYTAKAYKHK